MNSVRMPAQNVPVVAETDVLVVGGGPAGVCAAAAAARHGARTILVERYGYFGGLASGGNVLILWGFDNTERPLYGGIPMEIVNRLKVVNGIYFPPKGYIATMDPEMLKWVCLEMLRESGVQIVLHSMAIDAVCYEDNEDETGPRGVIFHTKAGREAILAEVVVDCSGDGDIAAWSGAEYEPGQQQIGVVARFGNVDLDRVNAFAKANPERHAELDRETQALWDGGWFRLGRVTPMKGVVWCNNSLPGSRDGLDARSLTEVEIGCREKIVKTLNFLRANMPGYEEAFLLDTASQIGVRETRRVVGEYSLNRAEMAAGARFPDAIAECGLWNDRSQPFAYDVPYRILVPRKTDHLLVAGRCVSAEQKAHTQLRVIPPCMATGEAAGTAAALAVKHGVAPRRVDVAELQSTLLEQGVQIHGKAVGVA